MPTREPLRGALLTRCSGQWPDLHFRTDPFESRDGRNRGDSIQDQVRQALENLKILLEAAGSSLDKAVKCTVYLQDLHDFEAMNEIYATYFNGKVPPARSTVQVASLPKGVDVEIDVIALE